MPQKSVSSVIEVAGADDAIGQVRRMRSALDDLASGGAEDMKRLRRQSGEVTQAMQEMKKAFQLRDLQKEMTGSLEDFFGRIISGARTTGDIFQNIWRQIADFFKRTVREMAAAWTLSLGGALAGGAVGGGFPLGNIFNLPATGPGTGFPPATRRNPTLAETLGLPATMPLGDILSGTFSRGIGPLSGSGVALAGLGVGALTIGNSNRAVSALGGAASGGLLGFSIGGPIGAGVGALIGGLVGLFTGGGGKAKVQDTAVANQGFARLREILDDFERFRIDFATALDAAHRVWNQMQAQFVRSESIRTQRPFFDEILSSIRRTEDERNRRRQLLSLQPLPEFAAGGAVPAATPSLPRGLLAVLHPGEFVMNRQSVERIGLSALEGLNSGFEPRASASGQTVTLEIPSQEFFNEVVERSIPVILRRGGKASRVLRG